MTQIIRLFISNILFLLALQPNIQAQTDTKTQAYQAFIQNDLNKWKEVTIHLESQKKTKATSLELLNCYYGYISHLVRVKNFDIANQYIPKAEKLVEAFLSTYPKDAAAHAYKAGFWGFRMGINKIKAITLSSETNHELNLALELDNKNTVALIIKANALYHTPKIFGGNKGEGLKMFKKAIQILENEKNTINNWMYISTLTLTAQAMDDMGNWQDAQTVYEKILHLEPEAKRVKNELYPALIKKIANNK